MKETDEQKTQQTKLPHVFLSLSKEISLKDGVREFFVIATANPTEEGNFLSLSKEISLKVYPNIILVKGRKGETFYLFLKRFL